MIVTPHCVFLHLHKCGGSFVNELLLRTIPGARMVGYHLPRSRAPAESAGLPVLGLVRSPWSYYVSWFAFQSARPAPNALYRIATGDGRRDFGATVRWLLTLGERERELEMLLRELPSDYVGRGLNLPAPALAGLRGRHSGFFSFLFEYMYGPRSDEARVGRLESLRDCLPAMLEDAGEPVSDVLRRALRDSPARNVSRHGPYADYYDAELRRLVETRDGTVIERFSYRFGD